MTPAEEQLSAYLDDELDATQRADVELLLQQDSELRKTLEKLRAVRSWMGELSRPTSVTSKPIAELLAASSKTITPSLNVQGEGVHRSRWFSSDWRWPAGFVTAAAIALSVLAMWPSADSFDVAYSTKSQGQGKFASPKPAENANSFKTDAIADSSQAIDAIPEEAKLAEMPRNRSLAKNAAALEPAAEVAMSADIMPRVNEGDLATEKNRRDSFPAAAEMASDSNRRENEISANALSAEQLGRRAGDIGVGNAGEMQQGFPSRGVGGGLGAAGGVAMGAPPPSAGVPGDPIPSLRASDAAVSGLPGSDKSGISVPAAPTLGAAPSPNATPMDRKESMGPAGRPGAASKSMDPSKVADAGASSSDRSRPESGVEAVDSSRGLGGGGLGGSAGAMATSPNRTANSAIENRQGKPDLSDRISFSRIYQENPIDRLLNKGKEQESDVSEVTVKRFEDLIQEAAKDVFPESVHAYQISLANWELISNWRKERDGSIKEFAVRNRDSKKQSSEVPENPGAGWVLLKVTQESWSTLAVKLEQAGEELREISLSSIPLPKDVSLDRVQEESSEQGSKNDQRILILLNLQ
jgi:hypothetical protein